VIPQYARQVLGSGSVIIYGSGESVRDYIYVDDVVQALAAAATADGVNRQVINIGTGTGTTIKQLVALIENVTGHKAQTIINPSQPSGVSLLVADISRARKLLNFKPKVSLEEGLAMLIQRDSQFAC
jgi:nucleoside-diphosphate-sugar epimerase